MTAAGLVRAGSPAGMVTRFLASIHDGLYVGAARRRGGAGAAAVPVRAAGGGQRRPPGEHVAHRPGPCPGAGRRRPAGSRRLVRGPGRTAGGDPGTLRSPPLSWWRDGHQPGLADAIGGLAGPVHPLDRAARRGRLARGGDLLRLPAAARPAARRAAAGAGHPWGGRQPPVPGAPGRGGGAAPAAGRVPVPPARGASGRIDLKAQGTAPIVDLARLFALEAGRPETGTVARLHAAVDEGTAGKLAIDLAAAFEDLQQLSVEHQAACLAAGAPADEMVAIGELTALRRRRLKDAMHLVHVCQESLRITYRTDLIA
jgi:hypothetical protein